MFCARQLTPLAVGLCLFTMSSAHAETEIQCADENLSDDAYTQTCVETDPKTAQVLNIRSTLHEKKAGKPTWAKAAQVVISGFALPYALSRPLPHGSKFYDVHFQVGAAIGAGSSALTEFILDRNAATRACDGLWHLEHCRRLKIKNFWISTLTGIVISSAAGALKEFRDMGGRGDPDLNDAVFTSLGGAVGSFSMSIPLDSIFKKRK